MAAQQAADTDRRLLRLHAADNVLVTRAPIAAGQPIQIEAPA